MPRQSARFAPATRPAFAIPLALALLLVAALLAGCGTGPEPATPVAPAPNGLDDGLAKVRTDTFTLSAYAVDSVHMAGTLNSWASADAAWQLTLQPDGSTWRLIKTVADGMHYYKFVVRKGAQTLWLTDP